MLDEWHETADLAGLENWVLADGAELGAQTDVPRDIPRPEGIDARGAAVDVLLAGTEATETVLAWDDAAHADRAVVGLAALTADGALPLPSATRAFGAEDDVATLRSRLDPELVVEVIAGGEDPGESLADWAELGAATADAHLSWVDGDGPVERWSDPDSWGGALPGDGDVVVIEAGRTVLLDRDAAIGGLMVHGTLLVEDARDIRLETGWLMAMNGGDVLIGRPDAPHAHRFDLVLTGDPGDVTDWGALQPEACPETGGLCRCGMRAMAEDETAFLMAMGDGSTVEIWGADAAKADWVRLAETAEAGSRMLVLDADAGWEVGDRIVVASTDFDADQAETATIVQVSADGRRVTLDRALEVMHFGALQAYDGGRILDTRAEVGLLSRNIVIQGDEDAHIDRFGGHLMAMDGAEFRISGVEFFRMGQEGRLGRYPIHWHQIGDGSGQWVTDSAFHESYNRAVTIHGTDNVLVQNTVAYDTVGHAYFLEDGSETGNQLHDNLGLLTRAAAPETATIPTDATHVSTFWLTNPMNDLTGNVAAGSAHSGFWFAVAPEQATLPLGRFEGNVAHSNAFSNLAIDGHADPLTGAFVESEYHPESPAVIRDFTSYKSADRAIWIRASDIEFQGLASADNARATFFSYNQTLVDGLIVGRSANIGTPETAQEIAQGRALPEPYNGRYFRGHSIYDGPSAVFDTHFAGFTDLDAAFQTNGAAQKSPVHQTRGLSFEDVTARGRVDFAPETWQGHMWSSGILDLDGSLTGTAGARLMPILVEADGSESRFNIPDGAERRAHWGAWVLPDADIGLLRADTDNAPGNAPTVLWSRSDGAKAHDGGTFHSYHQSAVVLNSSLVHRLTYPELPGQITLSLRFAEAGDEVIVELPNIPSDAMLTGAREVESRAALRAAESSAYLREGTLLTVKLVAETEELDPRFRPQAGSGAEAHRYVAGMTVAIGAAQRPVVADFEAPDPRLSASGQGVEVSVPEPAWEAAQDSIVFWDLTSDGTAGGSGELRLALGGQDWSAQEGLEVRAVTEALGGGTAAGYRLWLADAEAGRVDLGWHPGHAQVDLSVLAPELRDNVDALIFEVAEAAVAPESRAGDGQRILVFDATLTPAAMARPVVLPGSVAPGETYGIVGAAILGAQRAETVAVIGASDAIGGTVRMGAGEQAGNVFFEASPGFIGTAGFTAQVRDADGGVLEVPVRLSVG